TVGAIMRTSYLHLALATLVAVAAPLPAVADPVTEMNTTLDGLFGEHARYRAFFDTLKKAVADGDKAAVAAMVDYPFQARIGGKSKKIRDAARSEERRVGKECRARWWAYDEEE